MIMGNPKHLGIESKLFVLKTNGSFMIITEKSRKVVKEVRLGMNMVQRFAK